MYFVLRKSEKTATRLLYVPRNVKYIKYEDEIYSLEKERFPKIGSHENIKIKM